MFIPLEGYCEPSMLPLGEVDVGDKGRGVEETATQRLPG